jgi:hypothetical protein
MSRSVWKHSPSGQTVRRRRKHKCPPFVMLPKWMIESSAWQSLSGEAVATFIVLAQRYNGVNNGRLALATRTLAQFRGCSNATAARAMRELIEKGFAEVVRASGFNVKGRVATEYRLTLYRCDVTHALPSKAFMRWPPESISQSQNQTLTVSQARPSAQKQPSRSHQRDGQAPKGQNHSLRDETHVEISHSVCAQSADDPHHHDRKRGRGGKRPGAGRRLGSKNKPKMALEHDWKILLTGPH